MEDDGSLVGRFLQVDFDGKTALKRSGNRVWAVFDATGGCVVQSAVGNRSGGQPIGGRHGHVSRSAMVSGQLEDRLDLDRNAEGKPGDADGGTGMTSLVAQNLDYQLRRAVDDLRLVAEIGRAVDEAGQLDQPGDAVQVAGRGLGLGKKVDGAQAGDLLTVFHREIFAAAVFKANAGAVGGELPGDIEVRPLST